MYGEWQGMFFVSKKRLHPMLTLALKMLHFEKFAQQENIDLFVKFKGYLIQFSSSESLIEQAEVKEIFEKYEQFNWMAITGRRYW